MLNLVKVISTSISESVRKVKFLRYGKSDVQEKKEIGPYGIDSNPVEDMIAVYAPTGQKGKAVIIGYINKNQVADVGELRIYSTDSDGVEQNYMYLKNDGTIEIGGNVDFMVRYSKLETAFNQLKSDFNSLVTSYNSHVHPGVTVGAGSTAITPAVGTPSSANILPAKISEIKTS